MVRPLGPSMNAGLSPRSSACSRRNGVNATSGITTGGSGARDIIGNRQLPAISQRWRRRKLFLGDSFPAAGAHAVFAFLESSERRRDLLHRLPLHLNEREIDVLLDLVVGELGAWGVGRVYFPKAANFSLHLRGELRVS